MSGAAVEPRPSNRLLYGATALLLVAAIAVQAVRDRGWQPYQPASPLLWVQDGRVLQRLALGFDSVLADMYWIRAVVYYGGQRRGATDQKDFSALYPLLDLVTSLDGHFRIAYRFGAIFLTEAFPAGPGRPDLAIQLLERGIERDYGRWEYYHDIGFVYYWWLRDYQKAAEWFLRASERPGAAEWLKPLAATTLVGGGNRESSRLLWRQMLTSDMAYLRSQAQHRLMQLETLDALDRLTPVLQRFIDRERRTPKSWQELAAAERLQGVPADPTGVNFVFDPVVGHIDVSRNSTLWPLPGQAAKVRLPE
jgi:tetratricopeptide (TPR) repeat protein